MSRFIIGIVGRGKNPHVECFVDVAKALASALRALGHEVVPENTPDSRLIAFGANNLHEAENGPKIPDGTIIFNSEQLAAVADPSYFLQGYLKFRDLVVWDYSQANVVELKKLGIERAVHCPIGYIPSMTTIENKPDGYAGTADEQDIDVLHYGSIGDSRRREILDVLDKTSLNVVRLFGVYGAERDAIIARSKVVLNLHYYERGVFEIFRVSHLLANKKCVVTEAGGCDPQLEEFAQKTCEYARREDIVQMCQTLVAGHDARRFIAKRGFDEFKKISFTENVRRALDAS